jgi:glycosyltransferase involved in cell wall biosynthesis
MPLSPIKQRYLLVLEIPVFKDKDGAYWTDLLWHKDLSAHLAYIEDLTLACPCVPIAEAAPHMARLEDRIKVVELPSRHKLTLRLPVTAWRLWRAVSRADIVHTSLGGWLPISICNMTSFMARLRRRFLFIVVESSTWRLLPGSPASLLSKLKSRLSEWMNIYCLKWVSLGVFTHPQYKESLMASHPERGHVIHASWVDRDVIVPAEQSRRDWGAKLAARPFRLKLLFAGRLTAAKGVPVLLDVMRRLDAQGCGVELSVIGEGELRDECVRTRDALRSARIEMVESIPYGPRFFEFLRQFHAVVIPSITDEQPRIVYDAYSQGVPVLASDTAGLSACIEDGVTGKLCRMNDPEALLAMLEWAVDHPERLKAMGAKALERTAQMTHQQMHQKRWWLLHQSLSLQ